MVLSKLKQCNDSSRRNVVEFIDYIKTGNNHYLFLEHCVEGDLGKFIFNFNSMKKRIQNTLWDEFDCHDNKLENQSGQQYPKEAKKETSMMTLDENEAKVVIKDILQGLVCLNRLQIIHRDLKIENILVQRKPHAPSNRISSYEFKLGDLGLAKALQ